MPITLHRGQWTHWCYANVRCHKVGCRTDRVTTQGNLYHTHNTHTGDANTGFPTAKASPCLEMFDVGPALGLQLMAEIGDVHRFHSKEALEALMAYAGIDAPPNSSGEITSRHKGMSKVGAFFLRRTSIFCRLEIQSI